MIRTVAWTVLIPLALTACITVGPDGGGANGGDDDDDNATPTPTPTATPNEANPASGVWHYDEFTEVANNCNYTDPIPGQDSGDFGLVNNGDSTFTVYPGDNTADFDCNVSGTNYDCPARAADQVDLAGLGFNAVLDITASVSGQFADNETAIGEQLAGVDCTGTDCGMVASGQGISFPCQVRVDFTATWQHAL